MVPFSSLQSWLADQAIPLVYVGFALLMGVFVLYLSAASRRATLGRNRSGRTEDTFAEEMAGYGYDPDIARLTYCTLRDHVRVSFPIEPADELERDLGVAPDELSRITWKLLEATDREHTPGLYPAPIVTVAHLVRHVQTSPRLHRGLHVASA